jgi:hypothetical protein
MAAQLDTEQMSELDKLTARNNAAREAYGYASQAAAVRSGAAMNAMGARNAARATLLQGYLSGEKDLAVGAYEYEKDTGGLLKKSNKQPGVYVPSPDSTDYYPNRPG